MSAASASQEPGYHAGQRLSGRGRALAAITVVGLHAGGAAALLIAQSASEPLHAAPQLMQVTMIAEAPRRPLAPVPPAPVQSKPEPRLVATPKPTASSMVAPPPPPPPDEAPVTPVVAAAPAPPAASVPAEAAPEQVSEQAAEQTIVPPSFVAAYLNNPAPSYPYAAKQRRESGQVLLRVRVCIDGSAGDVRIERSSGSASLDAAAREVVFRHWRFVPAKRGDDTVEAWVLVPIVFELKG